MVIPFDGQAAYDQGVSRLTAETVRGRHRIPVIPGSCAHQVREAHSSCMAARGWLGAPDTLTASQTILF